MPEFSIVIPNWNGKKFLQVCFDAIATQTFTGEVETILVDNASEDDSVAYTQKQYPWVRVLQLDKNYGFAGGVNRGIEAAKGKIIILLNNDTEVAPGWLQALYNAAGKYPEAGFFASKMMDFKERDIIDACGDGMTLSGTAFKIGMGEKDGPKYQEDRFVFGACAGASAYRREFFEKVGLFDEDFFAYLEDIDLDLRAQLQGIQCLFVADALVYHIGSATSGTASPFLHKMVIKNHAHLIYKNYPWGFFFKHLHRIAYDEMRLKLAALKHGYFREYRQGWAQAWREHGNMKAKRKAIQASRVVSYAYLERIMEKRSQYNSIFKAVVGTLFGKK